MRKGFLVSFLILSCVQVISGLALADFHKPESKDPKVSKHLMVVQEKKGTNGSDNGNLHTTGEAEEVAAKRYAVFPEKAQKARGSKGGANVVHHRPAEKSAASVLQSPFVCIPTTTVCVSLFLLPVFPLLIV